MKLQGKEIRELRDALLSAYYTEGQLNQLTRLYLNRNLAEIADGENLRETVFELITWAERTNNIHALVEGAIAENPRPELQAWLNSYNQALAEEIERSTNQNDRVRNVPDKNERGRTETNARTTHQSPKTVPETSNTPRSRFGVGLLIGLVAATLIVFIAILMRPRSGSLPLAPADTPDTKIVVTDTPETISTNDDVQTNLVEQVEPTATLIPEPTTAVVESRAIDYFPLETSSSWTYNANLLGNQGVMFARVIEDYTSGERQLGQVFSADGVNLYTLAYTWSGDTLQMIGEIDHLSGNFTEYSPYVPILKTPIKIGDTWQWNGSATTSNELTGESVLMDGYVQVEVIRNETISLPFGETETIFVRRTHNFTNQFTNNSSTFEMWLSKDVGAVKSISKSDFGTSTMALQAFSP